jgi:hypothetical protein
MEQTNTPNPGKGMGTAGFVISLIALVAGIGVWLACVAQAAFGGGMILAVIWTVISLAGLILSIMGMNKSKAAGHKPGLAMGGMIVGILAVLFSIWIIVSVIGVQKASESVQGDMQDALNQLEQMEEDANRALDSMKDAE